MDPPITLAGVAAWDVCKGVSDKQWSQKADGEDDEQREADEKCGDS